MSTLFESYANYYDALYHDKDYDAEAHYVHDTLVQHTPSAVTILELGSGTGRHAALLARRGHTVIGVERSATMLAAATAAAERAGLQDAVRFVEGDIRTCRVDVRVDAVISLFHVISYQTSNQDVVDALATARAHLKPGGVFLFDVWYGPAVLELRPATRVKRIDFDGTHVIRIAEPTLDTSTNTVAVAYTVIARHATSRETDVVEETHRMRYFFLPELEFLLGRAGLRMRHAEEWLTRRPVSPATWGVSVIAAVN